MRTPLEILYEVSGSSFEKKIYSIVSSKGQTDYHAETDKNTGVGNAYAVSSSVDDEEWAAQIWWKGNEGIVTFGQGDHLSKGDPKKPNYTIKDPKLKREVDDTVKQHLSYNKDMGSDIDDYYRINKLTIMQFNPEDPKAIAQIKKFMDERIRDNRSQRKKNMK